MLSSAGFLQYTALKKNVLGQPYGEDYWTNKLLLVAHGKSEVI